MRIHISSLTDPSPYSPSDGMGDFGIFHHCHPERSEGSQAHKAVDVSEILPPYGRLDDKKEGINTPQKANGEGGEGFGSKLSCI